MPSDPDGLWPRRGDDTIDRVDEEREIDDVEKPLDEEVLDDDEVLRIDADDRPVEDLDDDLEH
ncbi:MAG: hypothetical protein JWQ59_1155 [Cryobacterium sp.]|jgi:hypothetical protein|nr:hypothetical protein [Cryobacterium sp.]